MTVYWQTGMRVCHVVRRKINRFEIVRDLSAKSIEGGGDNIHSIDLPVTPCK